MRHGLNALSTYRLNGQRMGDEHPAYAPDEHGLVCLLIGFR